MIFERGTCFSDFEVGTLMQPLVTVNPRVYLGFKGKSPVRITNAIRTYCRWLPSRGVPVDTRVGGESGPARNHRLVGPPGAQFN